MTMNKKQLIVALVLVLMIASSSYAENILEYKRVVLCANHMTVLVNRLTGKVRYKYVLYNRRKIWVLLNGTEQAQYQSMYEAQVKLKMVCH